MSKGTKGGYMPDKNRNKTIAQVSILVICFVMIVALTIMFSNFSKKKGEDFQNPELVQRKLPADDATVAVFETTKGTFKAVLYEEQAPEACKYFKDLVKTGYYDGTYVFGVQKDVYFLGGSKAKDGTDTDDTDKKTLDKEISSDLWPFKGALISFGGKNNKFISSEVSGSRILFVGSVEFTDEFKQELESASDNSEINSAFEEMGGVPNFTKQYTIFAQVYDGMDIYEKICKAGSGDESSITPTEEIKFTKVSLSTYKEHKNDSFFPAASDSSK